ncbi:MAG: hypothetical protein ACK4E0_17015 [Chitinophagaceae bacterium]
MKSLIWASFLIVSLSACSKMKEPEFRGIEAVKMGKLGLQQTKVKLHLRYFNPNKFKGTLKWAKGEAWVDSSYLGPFSVTESIVAAGSSEFTVPVELTLDMKQALNFTSGILSGREMKKEVWIKIDGEARAGRQGLFKTFSLKYEGPQMLDSLLAGISQ